MKNFKVLLLAMVAMVGLSSCFGEGDPTSTGQEFVRVDSYMGLITLKSAAGYEIKPSNSMDVPKLNGPFAQVLYQYNRDEVTSTMTVLNAKILYAEDILQIPVLDENRYEENAPMAGIMDGAATMVKFYDKNNIFLPLSFYYKQSSDQTVQNNEVKSHHFELKQIENDSAVEDAVTLRLTHHVDDPSIDGDRKSVGTMYEHIDLSRVLAGKKPTKLIIKYKRAGSNASMENAQESLSSITINYKEIIDRYFNTTM